MKGTAILIQNDQVLKILEDIDKTLFDELTNYSNHASTHADIFQYTLKTSVPLIWHEEEVDWEY